MLQVIHELCQEATLSMLTIANESIEHRLSGKWQSTLDTWNTICAVYRAKETNFTMEATETNVSGK